MGVRFGIGGFDGGLRQERRKATWSSTIEKMVLKVEDDGGSQRLYQGPGGGERWSSWRWVEAW